MLPKMVSSVGALLVLAGCIGAAPPSELQAPGAPGLPIADALVETVVSWSGSYAVGTAYDLPGHFPETAPLTAPVWPDQMRSFEITEVPRALAFELTWSGGPGTQLQLMVEGPGARQGTVNQWVDPAPRTFSGSSPLCVPVPAEELRAGHWLVMPHALVGTDIAFNITARMTGGAGALHEGHAGWASLPDFLQAQAEGRVAELTPAECAPS